MSGLISPRDLARELRKLSATEFSAATAAALNTTGARANAAQRTNLERDFTLRNKFTAGSLMMFKASPKKDASKIDTLVGSKSPYLPVQESGGTAQTRDGKPAEIMPTLAARRGSWARPVVTRFRLKGLGPIGRRTGSGRMTPLGAKAFWLKGGSLKRRTLFFRDGGKLLKVRIATRGPVRLKATHWHTEAAATGYAGMYRDWSKELGDRLAKMGAR